MNLYFNGSFLLAAALCVFVVHGKNSNFDRDVVRPSSSTVVFHSKGVHQFRLLETNETAGGDANSTEHAGDCLCDGTEVHCTDEAEEAHCSCDSSGVLTCEHDEEEHTEDCHCDGTAVHCTDEAEEAHCSCDSSGLLTCEHEEEHTEDCHCDGTEVHCTDEAEEAHCSCSADGVVSCEHDDYGCHCESDGTLHCDDEAIEQYCSCNGSEVLCEIPEQVEAAESSKPWSEVIISAVLVNLITLIGVFVIAGEYFRKLLCPSVMSGEGLHVTWTRNIIPMFACGALMATAFFLILPEALELIKSEWGGEDAHEGHNHRYLQEGDSHDGEAAATWRFGTAIIGGFLIPVVTHIWFPHTEDIIEELMQPEDTVDVSDGSESDDNSKHRSETILIPKETPAVVEDDTSPVEESELPPVEESTRPADKIHPKRIINWSLLTSVVIGDFFHNFSDGVFIGTAWLSCDRSLAVTIVAATAFHEIAQEIADYFLMVHLCGLKPWVALAVNFACGMSILLGGVLVLAADLTSGAVGIILCVSAGVYIHVAVSECLPTAERAQKETKHKLYGLLAFVCGAVPIGLILLNHQHC